MEKIREARIAHKMSQQELAAQLGVTQGAVSQWEGGKNHPSIRVLRRLMNVLDMSLEDLIGEEDE